MECIIKVEFDQNLYDAIKSEEHQQDRSSLSILKDEEFIIFKIISKDSVALRATVNGITKLITIYENEKRNTRTNSTTSNA